VAPSASVDVAVNRAGTLTGRVVSANAPADCEVVIYENTSQRRREPCVAGRFTSIGLPPATYSVVVRGSFARVIRTVHVADAVTTDLGTIVAEPGQRIAGRVIDGIGRPVANARVVAAPHVTRDIATFSALREPPDLYTDTTAADGRFAIDDLALDTRSLEIIAVSGDGRTQLATAVRAARPGDRDVELQLTGHGVVEIALRGGVAGATYMVWFFSADIEMSTTLRDHDSFSLAPGPYRVVVVRAGGDPKAAPGRELDVTEGTIAKVVLSAPP
jgi:hypothetical protein